MEYYECLLECKNDFLRGYELGKTSFNDWLNEPIYPVNEELYNEFNDEYGFDTIEFILYLIRHYDLDVDMVA